MIASLQDKEAFEIDVSIQVIKTQKNIFDTIFKVMSNHKILPKEKSRTWNAKLYR